MPPGQRADVYAQSVVRWGSVSHFKIIFLFYLPTFEISFFKRIAVSRVYILSYYIGQKKKLLQPRYSWDWSTERSCDNMRYRFFFFFLAWTVFKWAISPRKCHRMRWTALVACWCRIVPWDRRFSFPKNLHRQALWIAAVQQKDLEPKIKKIESCPFYIRCVWINVPSKKK